jgi:hypothetical protein
MRLANQEFWCFQALLSWNLFEQHKSLETLIPSPTRNSLCKNLLSKFLKNVYQCIIHVRCRHLTYCVDKLRCMVIQVQWYLMHNIVGGFTLWAGRSRELCCWRVHSEIIETWNAGDNGVSWVIFLSLHCRFPADNALVGSNTRILSSCIG